MTLWRFRITIADDPRTQQLLTAALAEQRVSALAMSARGTDVVGEVTVELPSPDDVGTLLNDLHGISPQVFVTSANGSPQKPPRRD
jgi:hypothetical protein